MLSSWRPEERQRPRVMSKHNLLVALGLHVAVFLGFCLFAICHGLFDDDEEIIPIDLTVVVNENLDGKEDEPPPLDEPPPPPPQPKPKPKPKPQPKPKEDPKPLDQIVTNIVKKVEKKIEKKEEPPKKTAKELREERMRKMRESATNTKKRPEIVVKRQPSGDGRTDKKELSNAEIMKLLNQGYKPGKSTQLAASDEQLGFSLIKAAFEKKWDKPPWTDTLKPMTIRVWFGPGGRIMRCKLESSSGDKRADQSIITAADRVGTVMNLPSGFIDKYKSSGVPVRFTVKPN